MASRGGGRPPPWVNPNTLRGVTSNPLGVGGPGRSLMAKRDYRVDQARLRHEQQQAAEKAAKTALEGLTSLRQAAETEHDEYLKLLESAPTEVEADTEYEKYLKLLAKDPSEIMDQEVWEATFESFRKALDVDHFPPEGTSLNIPPSQDRIDLYNALKLQQPSPTEATLQTGSLSWYNDPEEGYNLLAPPMSFEKFLGWKYPGVELADLAYGAENPNSPASLEKQLIRQANYTQRAGDSSSFEERRDNEGRDVATGEPWISPSQRLLDRGIGSLSAEDLPKGKFFKNLNFPEVGYEKGDLSPGQSVAIRPNLNFGRQNQTEDIVVQSVHKDSHSYDVLGTVYGAVIKDPQFLVNPRGQLQVQAHVFSKLKDTDPKKIPSIKASKPKYPLSSVQGELVRILSMEDSIEGRINRAGVIARFNPATTNLYVVKLGDNYHAIKSVKGEVSVEGNRVYIPPESTIQFYTPQELEKINSNRATIAKELGLEKALDTEVKIFAQGGFVDKPLYDRDRSYYG